MLRNLEVCALEDLFSTIELYESRNAKILEQEKARSREMTIITREKKKNRSPTLFEISKSSLSLSSMNNNERTYCRNF